MKAFHLILASALSTALMLSVAPAFSAEPKKFSNAQIVQKHVRQGERRDDHGHRNQHRHDHRNQHGHDNRRDQRHDLRNDHRHNNRNHYGPGYYPNHRYLFPLYDGRRHDHRRGYWHDYHRGHHHGYRHRHYKGYHYYYNNTGFYFPGYGHIAHGHRHSRHCPHWHFEDFAAGLILGAIISH
ncbi:MAG TPA: hypothetical protein VF268_01985 [Gammaproteobacteria bacterium]